MDLIEFLKEHKVEFKQSGEQHGKTLRGEKANGAKATKLQVIKIRKMFKTGKYPTVRAIANRINLPIGVVRDIIKFATWRHVCS